MLDEKIEKRIDLIEDKKELLEKIYRDTEESARDKEAIENCLRKIVSAVIDIASRLISLEGFRRPETYADYFLVLEEEGIIPKKLKTDLQEMAAFRNLLVHQYSQVDFEKLREIVEEDLQDTEKFVQNIQEWFRKREG